MKKRTGDDWFPFWIDKWLLGSTRDELTVEQCAVWVDFLALSYKDEGYIRANVGFPYPIKRLAGLLNRSEELIESTIKRCLDEKIKKLKLMPDGTLYVISHPEYELSKRHKRRIVAEEKDAKSGKEDIGSGKEDPRGEENREEEIRIEEKSPKGDSSTTEAVPLTKEEEIAFLWNQFAHKHGLVMIQGIEKRSTRQRHLNARMKKKTFDFNYLLEIIENSPFLLGRVSDFRATFDWILKPSNYQKIIEGNYLDKSKSEIQKWLESKKKK
jgi:hypothetical protein